jgi:hypothetical protein
MAPQTRQQRAKEAETKTESPAVESTRQEISVKKEEVNQEAKLPVQLDGNSSDSSDPSDTESDLERGSADYAIRLLKQTDPVVIAAAELRRQQQGLGPDYVARLMQPRPRQKRGTVQETMRANEANEANAAKEEQKNTATASTASSANANANTTGNNNNLQNQDVRESVTFTYINPERRSIGTQTSPTMPSGQLDDDADKTKEQQKQTKTAAASNPYSVSRKDGGIVWNAIIEPLWKYEAGINMMMGRKKRAIERASQEGREMGAKRARKAVGGVKKLAMNEDQEQEQGQE